MDEQENQNQANTVVESQSEAQEVERAEDEEEEEGGEEEEEEEDASKKEEDELVSKALSLMEKITSSPDNPKPTVLHALASILEIQEFRYCFFFFSFQWLFLLVLRKFRPIYCDYEISLSFVRISVYLLFCIFLVLFDMI